MTTNNVYQSGEMVKVEGIYHAVGVDLKNDEKRKEHAVVELKTGQIFPDYGGRAICWLLAEKREFLRGNQPASASKH